MLDTLLANSPRRFFLRDRLLDAHDNDETKAVAAVKADPYGAILAIDGGGWVSADAMGRACGIEATDPKRLTAALTEVMQREETWGHCWHPPSVLARGLADLAGVSMRTCQSAIESAAETGAIYLENPDTIWFPKLHGAETQLASAVVRLSEQTDLSDLEWDLPSAADEETDILKACGLYRDQLEAIQCVRDHPFTIITGPPGTGKTHLLKFLLDLIGDPEDESLVEICAPTGRAAKRVTELTGAPASTIHMLLGPGFRNNQFYFKRQEVSPDWLIIEEASMLPVTLARSLLSRVADGTRIVLVGDPHQLPAVGPGDVLRDLIRSQAIPTATLRTIKRQSPGKLLLGCHAVLNGQLPDLSGEAGADLRFLPASTDAEAADTARALLGHTEMREAYGGTDDYHGIQIISPKRTGSSPIACNEFNAQYWRTRHGENGAAKPVPRVGDKIMVTKNDYKHGVMNGDLGRVTKVGKREITTVFAAPEREVVSRFGAIKTDFAWCSTVHKGQGGEWPITILLMHEAAGPFLLSRALFYTALSRARNLCVIVGTKSAIEKAVKNDREERRRTGLADRVRGMVMERRGIC